MGGFMTKKLAFSTLLKLVGFLLLIPSANATTLPDCRKFVIAITTFEDEINGKIEERHSEFELPSEWSPNSQFDLLALKSTHAENVSHLDIKPPNIVFARGSDSFRLIDFGISKTQSAQGVGSKISGTWTYMPLEQFEGTPHKQSDIWSLGVTLYEVATDIHPIVSKHPDWTSMSEFDKYQACYNFAVAPEVDWTLVNNEGHRQLIKSMIEPALHKRPTPSVLLQELRAIQGYRDPILTLGGARGPYCSCQCDLSIPCWAYGVGGECAK
jgi:serine/threonine protein kinase